MPENKFSPELLSHPARRSVVKAAAWAVPVIAASTAVPLAAASTVDPSEDSVLNLTAFNVSSGGSNAYIEANGVRISPLDPMNPKEIPAGTLFTITIEYTGTNDAIDFRKDPIAAGWNKGQNPSWSTIQVSKTKLVFTATSSYATSEPTIGSIKWYLDPNEQPEQDSIVITGTAVIPQGKDFPEGGVIPNLVVDPNQGTGSLSGPKPGDWTAL